ncbi:MAG: sensor histidine kinase [Anaerolineae bacterium]
MSLIPEQWIHTTQDGTERFIGWRWLLAVVFEVTLVAIFSYVVTMPLLDQLGVHWLPGTALYGLLVVILNYATLNTLAMHLERVDKTLMRLNQNESLPPLIKEVRDPLRPIRHKINQLIDERHTLTTMRGKLYEQISEAAAQEERNRLARDLHDSIKQQVFSMSISAAAAHAHLDQDPIQARAALLDVRQSAQEAMVEMRALLQQLAPAPLEKSGLIDALREQAEAFSYRTGAQIVTEFGQLPDDTQFPIGAQEAVFRIAQEALSNIARHARAHHVQLRLKQHDAHTLILAISDDGQGFDIAQVDMGMGLNNIRSRIETLKGTLHLDSVIGEGTHLSIHLPLIQLDQTSEESETDMKNKQKDLLGRHTREVGQFAGAISAIFITLPLLFNNPWSRGVEIMTIDWILLGIIIVAFISGIVISIISLWRTQTIRSDFLTWVDRDNPLYYRFQRYTYLGYTVIGVVGFWMMPTLWLTMPALHILASLTALSFLLLVIGSYYQAYRVYDRELQMKSPAEREQEIDTTTRQVQAAWGSWFGLVLVLAFTDVWRNGIVLLPETSDEWITTSMILIAGMLFLNQVLQLWYYRQQRRALADKVNA